MEPRIIKTDEQYRMYLKEVERLVGLDPGPDSTEGTRLELLAKLVEDYEKGQFVFEKPDPVDAIVFRMEQQGLRQKDIAPLLGGPNRASEVLARKRPLTITMIRALHAQLGIPLDLLIREPQPEPDLFESVAGDDIPRDLLVQRGWLDARMAVSELLARFEKPIGTPILLRHTRTFGSNSKTKMTYVWLWLARVREIGDSLTHVHARFRREELNEDLLRYVAKLSFMERGPRLAKDFLEEKGIALVVEPHLPHTFIDGAAMIGKGGAPIIGLTIRENRLDNFWFTLMHELVHAWKHLDVSESRAIADESIEKALDDDPIEREANEYARNILVPRAIWKSSDANLSPNAEAIRALAADLQIDPAIVAGRVRYENRDYRLFSRMIGNGQVRRLFPEIRWG